MIIRLAYTDGTFGNISGVKYYPKHASRVNQFELADVPGGLWITEDALFEHLTRVNAAREKMGVEPRKIGSPRECCELVAFAEAPLEIYAQTEDGAPWKHRGTLVKKINYGPSGDPGDFWDED